jgi:ligand-binding sensor domain-containing protein
MALLLLGTLQCARVPTRSLPTSWITSHPGWATYTNANQVSDLAFDSDGNLWAVGNGGVVKWNLAAGTNTKFTVDDGLANDCVSSVAIALDGAVWVGTRRGASRFDGHTWKTYTTQDGLAENHVVSIVLQRYFGISSFNSRSLRFRCER